MSVTKLREDLSYWFLKEKDVSEYFKELWRKIIPTEDTDILDFKIEDKNWNEVWMELKSRRCSVEQYEDSMIGINKLIEAYKRYNEWWIYTIFAFKFTDGLYYINPFFSLPRFDYKRGRWDRGKLDQPKGWVYYKTSEMKKIY